MTKTYLALGFFIIYKLLAGDAYGNTKLKRPFGQKNQTSHNIGAYKNGKKVAQLFPPSVLGYAPGSKTTAVYLHPVKKTIKRGFQAAFDKVQMEAI